MTDTTTRTAQKARRHLATVSEGEVTAMRECDPESLAAMVTIIHTITTDGDVREHAAIICASLRTGAKDDRSAARAAVAIAKRAVALSNTLDSWDSYGDMTEDVATTLDRAQARSGLSRYAPDPAARFAVTYGDLVTTALGMLTEDDASELRAACLAYAAHARTCEDCTTASAQRVTLAGVRAHVDGRGAKDSTYHSERRAVLAALGRVPSFSRMLATMGDPTPMAPAHESHKRVSLGDCAPVSTSVYVAPVRTVTTPVRTTTEREVTTTRTGRVVTLTHAEPTTTQARAWRAAQRELDAAHHAARRTFRSFARAGATYTTPDDNGYAQRLGYGVNTRIARAEVAERAAYSATVTRTDETREHTTTRTARVTTTEHTTPRSLTEEESNVSTAREAMGRHEGEEYRGGTHGAVSAQADAFIHAPRAEANSGQATTPGQQLPSGAVPVSPRKKARTGATGPSVPAW